MSTVTAAEPTREVGTTTVPGYVVSRGFDLAFFVLPPLATIAFLLAQRLLPDQASVGLWWLVWVVLAQSHFGATLLFFLDRSHRAHYRNRPLVYFVVPALLIVGYLLASTTTWHGTLVGLVPIASFWHGNRQSFGVCGLYRGLARGFSNRTRRLELAAVFCGNACFTALGVRHFGMFGVSSSDLPPWLIPLWWSALSASVVVLALALSGARRECASAGLSAWPRLVALSAAWAMYLPYVFAANRSDAFVASLIPHYLQYHGLLFLIHKRKLDLGALAAAPTIARMVKKPISYASATVGFGVASGIVVFLAPDVGLSLVAGINMAHFWLDGFFWRFRDPHVRDHTLRYLRSA